MAARAFSSLRILALVGVVLSACDGLTLVAESTHVPLGGTIVITCKTVISYDNLMTLKKVYPEDLMRPYVDIADNQFLNAPFKDLERYSMTYIPEADSMFEFILTITDALVGDSGNYTCQTTEEDKRMVSVAVVVPPTTIQMTIGTVENQMRIIDDGDEVEFDGGEHQRIICNVEGGNPIPQLRITAGDIDIIDEFEISRMVIRQPTEVKGLVNLDSSITAEASALEMRGAYSGKKIACTAEAPIGGAEPISVGFHAKFNGYAPIITCTDTLISYTHQKNVNITCEVQAEPRPDEISISYRRLHTNTSVKFELDGSTNEVSNGQYRAEVHDSMKGEGTLELVLTIDRVSAQMFRNYYFVAANSFGKTEHKVYLERDQSREVVEDDAPRITGVIALVTLAVLVPLLSYL